MGANLLQEKQLHDLSQAGIGKWRSGTVDTFHRGGTSMPYEDEDLLQELIVESAEHLAAIEPDLLSLEKEGGQVSSELINRIFRAMHSIKGGFAFFGLTHIVNLSHAMESVLMRVRDGEMSVTPRITDALLGGVDKLRVLLEDVRGSENIPIEKELEPLNCILEGGEPDQAETAEAEQAAAEEPGEALETESFGEGPDAEEAAVGGDAGPEVGAEAGAAQGPGGSGLELVKPRRGQPAAGGTAVAAKSDKVGDATETIRVKVDLLDSLMNLAGELVLGRNQIKLALNSRFSDAAAASSAFKRLQDDLTRSRDAITTSMQAVINARDRTSAEQAQAATTREFDKIRSNLDQALALRLIETPGLSAVMQDVDLVTSELQSSIMNTRMQPVSAVFSKFPRIMRDLSRKVGKEIELTLIGQDVELDKSIIEALGDPLTHLVRNSADHGIEPPEAREADGKPRVGKVRLRAYHEGGQVNIDVTDDGAGIDPARVKSKAIERGILTQEAAERMTDREAIRLIFAPGFSTAAVVSDVSGRGVGMDVVRTNIERLGGTVEVESTPGEGTRINLRLPLTLAIIPSLIVGTGSRRYAVPQVNLEELVRVRGQDVDKRVEEVRGKPVLRLRGKLLPLVSLSEVLRIDERVLQAEDGLTATGHAREGSGATAENGARARAMNILVLKVGSNRYGLIVEKLLNNEEIVVKPLSGYLKECKHYAGSTIMGDGRVAMILDAAGIAVVAGLRFGEMEEEAARISRQQTGTQAEVQPLLLFRNSASELFAISLALVARIEKVRASEIERIGAKEYVKYDRSSMRILRLHDFLTVDRPAEAPTEFFIIVPKLVRHPMGIVATKIEDILHTDADIDRENVSGLGILGSAVLEGRLAVFLDIYSLFEAAEPDVYKSGELDLVADLTGKRVLLAEDTAFFRSVESEYLRTFGCMVETARDGGEAWEQLQREPYDLLVTDIEMPILNGFELAERVRANEKLRNLPIVAVTSLFSEGAERRGREVGIDAYEVKLDKDRLHQALADAMRKRSGGQPWSANSQPSTSEMPVSA
jgi:two-component system chemotaxis sensor kinase CheA